MGDSLIGKEAEAKIKEWLDRPEDGYSFDRIKDQMTGFYGSSNICDFTCFKSPYMFYIESKATWEDRFSFDMLTKIQHDGLLEKSKIDCVFGLVVVLFATYRRAFIIDIRDLVKLEAQGMKSINIKKHSKWPIQFPEIKTISSKKKLLDYEGELIDYLLQPSEDAPVGC